MAKKPTIRPVLYRVCMIGSQGVGKSALSKRFLFDEFMGDFIVLIDDYYKKILLDDEEVQIDISHTKPEDYAIIRDFHFRRCDGFLCIFSITDDASFQATEDFKEQLLGIKGDKNIPFLLVGNKCDLEERRKVTFQEASDRAKKWGVTYVETSARMNEHVDKVFFDLLREIRAYKMEESKTSNGKGKDNNMRKKLKCVIL